ncbi:thiamine pyrophosphate-binding protein [Desulfosporosinus fructosivorans]
MSEKMTGGRAVVKTLEAAGTELAIGYIGHTDHEIADALLESTSIRSILCRTELTGSFMIDGYNRVKRAPKAVGIFHGPGTPQILGGLAGTMGDSIPNPMIIGSVHQNHRDKGALQDTPVADLCKPFAKSSVRVDDGTRIPEAIQKAFKLSTTGRPGPTVVEIPYNLAVDSHEVVIPNAGSFYEPVGRIAGDPDQVQRAVNMLINAKRPALLAGGGVIISDACAELKQLAEYLQIPVAVSGMGKGAFSSRHELSVGNVGVVGWKCAQEVCDEADVLVTIGFRFAEFGYAQMYTLKAEWKLIHIDIDPAEIGRAYPAEIGIVGDAKLVLGQIIEGVKAAKAKDKFAGSAWLQRCSELKQQWQKELDEKCQDNSPLISPYRLVRELRNGLTDDSLMFVDVGNNECWGVHVFDTHLPNTFHMGGGYGHLGWSFPAAMGAKLAMPDKTVVSIIGDGGFHFAFHELGTAVKENIPVIVVVFNDGWLNCNRQIQDFCYESRYSFTQINNPDFVKLADSFGVAGLHVNKPEEIQPALQQALAAKAPFVLDVKIDDKIFFPATGFWKPRW